MIEVTLEELKENIVVNQTRYHGIKPYVLPSIPKVISFKDYDGVDIPLGMSITHFNWLTINKDESLFVLATYENEFYGFYELMKEKECSILYLPKIEQVKLCLHQQPSLIFMTIDQYQILPKEIKDDIPILYVGSGFHEQYTIRYLLKEKLASNEALYLSKTKKEVIQLVEKGN